MAKVNMQPRTWVVERRELEDGSVGFDADELWERLQQMVAVGDGIGGVFTVVPVRKPVGTGPDPYVTVRWMFVWEAYAPAEEDIAEFRAAQEEPPPEDDPEYDVPDEMSLLDLQKESNRLREERIETFSQAQPVTVPEIPYEDTDPDEITPLGASVRDPLG